MHACHMLPHHKLLLYGLVVTSVLTDFQSVWQVALNKQPDLLITLPVISLRSNLGVRLALARLIITWSNKIELGHVNDFNLLNPAMLGKEER